MDPKNIERYSRWARPVLEAGVRARMLLLGIAAASDASRVEARAASAGGAVLSAEEARMRDALLAELDAKGEDELVRRAAYTWFNRLLALRYLELKGLLPHGRHVLSDASGTGLPPEATSEPEALNLPTLPREAALRLKAAGDAQATFRAVLVAQAGALAKALPKAFGPEGDPLVLLLPDGLLGPEGAVRRLVEDLPAEDLERPEALGWAYQYWAAEEKDSVFAAFKKGRKAGERELPVATQLFTPDWIVDYLVQNSLGRLWMLNNPDSLFAEEMPYYVAPEGETEPTLEVSSPEEIAFCDPACGSGHMLLAAFRLLGAMYEEVGYRRRDVPALVLASNLSGMEIDARAAQLAELCLALEACSWDRNFLAHPTSVDITVLKSVSIDPSELPRGCALAKDKDLLDALSHLSLAGSLLEPSAKDVSDIKGALASLPGGLGDADLRKRLDAALASCEALSRRFSVVVTNPPYMGSKNMAPWLKVFAEKHYPEVKRDLFSCFIKRCAVFGESGAEIGMMTPFVWMFIAAYEELRAWLVDEKAITNLVQLEYSGFAGATVPICAFTYANERARDCRGAYIRLSDFVGARLQGPKTLEAIKNPSCGWFYRRTAADFNDIPGTPIAYWASDAVRRAFREGEEFKNLGNLVMGLTTGNNDLFMRNWWEVSHSAISRTKHGAEKWFPCNGGGAFRRWSPNGTLIINWQQQGDVIRNYEVNGTKKAHLYNSKYLFKDAVSWNLITSGKFSARAVPAIFVRDQAGPFFIASAYEDYYLGLMNTSVFDKILRLVNPTLNTPPGTIGIMPVFRGSVERVCEIVDLCKNFAHDDFESFETSRSFSNNTLVPKNGI